MLESDETKKRLGLHLNVAGVSPPEHPFGVKQHLGRSEREFWGIPVSLKEKPAPKEPADRQRVNPEMIVLGRELRGLTQAALARQINATQGKISKLEDGFLSVSAEDLENMISALKLPRAFFFRQDVKRPVFASFFRKRSSLPKKFLTQFNARVCMRQAQIERLLRRTKMERREIPFCNPDEYPGGPKEIAQLLRQFFHLPAGPIKNLIQALEDAGIVVVSFDFGAAKLDGVSTFTNSRTPVIFINSALPSSRRKFTLVHELAHIIMHRLPRLNAEEEAHLFAAEFLMPEADIANELKPINIEHLEQLKLKWGVAIAALLKRSETLGLITRSEATSLWIELSARGYRRHEPHEEFIQEEQPGLERGLIETHLNELGFTRAGVLELLDLSQSELDDILQAGKNNPFGIAS